MTDISSLDRMAEDRLLEEMDALGKRLGKVREQIERMIYGQREVVDQTLTSILAGGHVLFVGVPGLGKTRLVSTIGTVLGLEDKRIQCTPDLMPADIVGSEVMEEDHEGRRHFRFIRGPVFCQLLMADEINRASPRTQSALLQAMQEHTVTVAGQTYGVPTPFHVLATQNPLEQEGTYPLPEAQLDRFMLQVTVSYPDLGAERQMLLKTTGASEDTPLAIFSPQQLREAQVLLRRAPVGESVVQVILSLVRSGRPETSDIDEVRRHVAWGPGPRASQALLMTARARAVLDGRIAPSVEDVLALAHPVLRHRMALNFSAQAEGVTLDSVINALRRRHE